MVKDRIVAEVDSDIKKAAKIYALENGTTLAVVVERALIAYITPVEEPESKDDIEIN